MNFGSARYMSVNGTNPGNNSNIYQLLGNGDGAELFQKFKLEYVSSTGGYLLRSMVSSSGTDKVVSINRGTSGVSENMNIRLSSPGDSIGQEWLIVPVDYYEFKIVPRANMSLAITAYGNSNGSNTGTSYNSSGNIFVKEYDVENNNQRWYIDDSDGEALVGKGVDQPFCQMGLSAVLYAAHCNNIRHCQSFIILRCIDIRKSITISCLFGIEI